MEIIQKKYYQQVAPKSYGKVELSPFLVKYHAIKIWVGGSTSLYGGEWSASGMSRSTPWETALIPTG
jgi:hypothetical protein